MYMWVVAWETLSEWLLPRNDRKSGLPAYRIYIYIMLPICHHPYIYTRAYIIYTSTYVQATLILLACNVISPAVRTVEWQRSEFTMIL